MKDIDKLKNLFNEFGIEIEEYHTNDGNFSIVCEKGRNKISGYSSFYTEFTFNKKGKFIEMGAWE